MSYLNKVGESSTAYSPHSEDKYSGGDEYSGEDKFNIKDSVDGDGEGGISLIGSPEH